MSITIPYTYAGFAYLLEINEQGEATRAEPETGTHAAAYREKHRRNAMEQYNEEKRQASAAALLTQSFSAKREAKQRTTRRTLGRWEEIEINDMDTAPSWKHTWEDGHATTKLMAIGKGSDGLPCIQMSIMEVHVKKDGKVGSSKTAMSSIYGKHARAVYETLRAAFEGENA